MLFQISSGFPVHGHNFVIIEIKKFIPTSHSVFGHILYVFIFKTSPETFMDFANIFGEIAIVQ